MEYCSELKRNSKDQQSFETSDKTKLPQASPRINLQDRINLEKPDLTYADFHREIMKKVKEVAPKSPGNHQKQQASRKGKEEDELVKYMSKLPSYLERGKNPQEKVLSVGVLDWGRLERWQCSQKHMSLSSGRSSLSSSNLSSSFSTDASSSNSSRSFICSPGRQRMHRSSLQSHFTSSSVESHSQVVKTFGESVGKFPDLRDAQSNTLNKERIIRTDQSFDKSHQQIGPSECKRKNLDAKTDQKSGTLPNGVKYEVQSSTKGKMKTQDVQFMKKTEKLQQGNQNVIDHGVLGKQNTVVLLLPRDLPKNNLSGVPNLSASTNILGERPLEASRRSFSERSKDADLDSHVPHSCPLLCEVDSCKNLQMGQTSPIETKSGKSSVRFHSVPRSARIGTCPSGGSDLEDGKSTMTINKPTANGPFVESDLRASKVAPEKGRSTSPFRRLSFSMGKIGKSSGSKEIPIFSKPSSTYVYGQSGLENAVASSTLNSSNSDKSNNTTKARSSPLRRLLDPILKPKPANCRNVAEPLPKDSISKDRASKVFDGRSYSSTVGGQPGRVKLNMNGCKTTNVNDSFQEKKHESSAVEALLRVAVKNGQPLFTFAVDNESDILAATVKTLSTSRKEDYSCIYTFFTIQEVKKKNTRWLNQGGKGQSHDYIPNVVAQMKVFGSHYPNMSRENHVNQFSLREFVLFSVELRQSDQQTSDFQPNDELAAMVVKIPLRICRSSVLDGYQSDMQKDLSQVGPKEYLPEVTGKVQNRTFVSGQDISATVILPSGVHSLPRKGEPSSLIHRWKSGGSCDCGGWDLGCKLRVFANRNQLSKTAGSSKACSRANQFELFSMEGVPENQPFFSLAPFKDGIYSVEFHSSLSLLQAFSTCIAVLDSRKPCVSSESSDLFEEKTLGETTLPMPNDGTTTPPDRFEGEVPARYVSYPPLSPVGRV